MSTQRNGLSRGKRLESFRGDGRGPNWILIAGGALLSTLSVRFGYKLKQLIDSKHRSKNVTGGLRPNGTFHEGRPRGGCCLRCNAPSCERNNDCCFHCNPEIMEGKEEMVSPSTSLPLVTVTAPSYTRENGVMWASSPEHLEVPTKQYNHHSTCSDSPCVSESGSDIFNKREVIQKLRQQVKRRDDMILEMQDQIIDLQNSLNSQISHSSHVQTQIDATNRDMFESEREVQRLRKAIADHCVGHVGWNGDSNVFMDSESNYEAPEKGVKDGERGEMLRKEVCELKEVIDGKEYLLRSYKEQKTELSQKVKELQQKLDSQLPNIL
ncbi:unnamed protein product [Cochlearia groenlandica]